MIKRNGTVIAALAALLAVGSVAAVADGDDSNPPSDVGGQVTAVEPAAAQALDVLGGARTDADALPEPVASQMDAEADFGMNPGLSQLAIGNATNSVYVVPAEGRVCAALTVGEGASVACPTTAELVDGRAGPTTVLLQTGDIGVYGLVPDGVESVAVAHGDSDVTHAEVTGNAYYTVVPAGTPLRTVRYVGPSGEVGFPLADPTAED